MKDTMTTAWAWVVAILIYGIIIGTVVAYVVGLLICIKRYIDG